MPTDRLKLLIVEDDLIIGAHLSSILEQAGYEVLDNLTKGEQVPGFIDQHHVDLILMDINLAGQLDGIETAKIIHQTTKTPVVFLTGNHDPASFQRSKEACPVSFIAKPFNEEDLLRTIELLFYNKEHESEEVIDHFTTETKVDNVFVKAQNKMVKIAVKDILYVEAERNYCKIHAANNEFLLTIPLVKFEQKVGSSDLFRIHRSYLVNLNAIDELDDSYVFIAGKAVPMGKSYKEELSSRLKFI